MPGVMSDAWIREQCKKNRMIEPFFEGTSPAGAISYGVSSYGYDIRISDEFKVFTNVLGTLVDPKHMDERSFIDVHGDSCIIPSNGFALARSLEYFRIPRETMCIVLGKSTYARAGIIVNVTPLEPEWQGNITIEISNTTPLPVKIYANEGIAQVLFLDGVDCTVSYADKHGKYQNQTGITLPKVTR
jgi:dCTP deaminase